MPPTIRFLILALLLCAATPGQDGRSLFLAHCATCHGATGRGDGPTVVEPRPRDLSSGRLSSGTDPEVLSRAVRDGVPPAMPAYGDRLEAAEVDALVRYVRSLIPATIEASQAESQVAIGDVARVVRGGLPATGERSALPRGMVIGLTNGWSLEYRTDDLRLVSLRTPGAGAPFVDRTDWRGRGGSPLALLGELVGSEEPDPDPTVATAGGETALRLAFDGHRVSGPRVILGAHIIDGSTEVGRWREIVRGVETELGRGVHRRIEIRAEGPPFELRLRVGALLGSASVNRDHQKVLRGERTFYWSATPLDGSIAVLGVRTPRGSYLTIPRGHLEIIVPLGDRPLTRLEVLRMELPRMTRPMAEQLAEEFDR